MPTVVRRVITLVVACLTIAPPNSAEACFLRRRLRCRCSPTIRQDHRRSVEGPRVPIPDGPAAAAKPDPSPPQQSIQDRLPKGSPPLDLDGYCPVTLKEKEVWKRGDIRYGAVHRGRTYLFASESEQAKFLEDPDAYGPLLSGNDLVLLVNEDVVQPGKREHGLFYKGRVLLFATPETYRTFTQNPQRYITALKEWAAAAAEPDPFPPQQSIQERLPKGSPPPALDGYCPVTLKERVVWKRGDIRYSAVHRDRTYLFASESEQATFLEDPDAYSPLLSGNDLVLVVDQDVVRAGKREHGLIYQGRILLFATPETYRTFTEDPKHYMAAFKQMGSEAETP